MGLFFFAMRYHTEKPGIYAPIFAESYICDHPVYDRCTLYKIGDKGLAVIQQRCDFKRTYWDEIDPWLVNPIYIHPSFKRVFDERGGLPDDCHIYPTITVRQLMWALRMKPIKRERWETVFDRRYI